MKYFNKPHKYAVFSISTESFLFERCCQYIKISIGGYAARLCKQSQIEVKVKRGTPRRSLGGDNSPHSFAPLPPCSLLPMATLVVAALSVLRRNAHFAASVVAAMLAASGKHRRTPAPARVAAAPRAIAV